MEPTTLALGEWDAHVKTASQLSDVVLSPPVYRVHVCVFVSHDVLRENRVMGDVDRADLSNFLHPVIYYYKEVPKGKLYSFSSSALHTHTHMHTHTYAHTHTFFHLLACFLGCIIIFSYEGVEIGNMPKPTSYHHVVEDFLTDW